MLIYDCFLFNDELELLELRIEETKDVVHKWVLVECRMNWQQKRKPLFFEENKQRFAPYLDRIHHVILEQFPVGPYPVIEHFQRRSLRAAWEGAGAVPGDLIMISDADEIAHPRALWSLLFDPPQCPIALTQCLFYYSVDCLQMQPWNGPIVFQLGEEECDVQALRDMRNKLPTASPGGWHFSWLGPLDRLQYKLNCHTVEADSGGSIVPPDAADEGFLTDCMLYGKDLFGRTDAYAEKRFVSLAPGALHPFTIEPWLAKYPQFARRIAVNAEVEAHREQHGI